MNKQFFEEKKHIPTKNTHLMAYSNTLIIREKLVKTRNFYFTPVILMNIRKQKDTKHRQVSWDRASLTKLLHELQRVLRHYFGKGMYMIIP